MKNFITLFILVFALGIGTGYGQILENDVGQTYLIADITTTPSDTYWNAMYGPAVNCSPQRGNIIVHEKLPDDVVSLDTSPLLTDTGVTSVYTTRLPNVYTTTESYPAYIETDYTYDVYPANSGQLRQNIEIPPAPPGYKVRIEYVPLE